MSIKKIFFLGSQNGAAVPLAEHLCRGLTQKESLWDLSDTLILLPGRQAIRALTRELAHLHSILLLPEFATAGVFRNMGINAADGKNPPLPMEKKLLWMQVLDELSPEDFPSLFPCGIIKNNRTLAELADQIIALKRELELRSSSFTIEKANELLQNSDSNRNFPELALLERRYRDKLAEYSLDDPADRIFSADEEARFFLRYRRIVVAACPDLPPFAKEKLLRLEQTFEKYAADGYAVPALEICITAGYEWRDYFDSYGCVIPEAWANVILPFKTPFIHSVNNVEEMALLAGRLALTEKTDENTGEKSLVLDCANTSVVVTQSSFFPELEKAFSHITGQDGRQITLYNPDGVHVDKLRLGSFLSALSRVADGDELEAVYALELLRQESVLNFFAGKYGVTADMLLKCVDLYCTISLPDRITSGALPSPEKLFSCCRYDFVSEEEGIRSLTVLSNVLKQILTFRTQLRTPGKTLEHLREICSQVFNADSYPLKYGISLEDEAVALRSLCAGLEKSTLFAESDPVRALILLTDELISGTLYTEHAEDSLEVTGFLDTPFRSADKVILCGMSEGFLPERNHDTPYLNDPLRKALSLPDNASKYARDCFYVTLLLDKTAFNVHFISPKYMADGSMVPYSTLYFSGVTDVCELLKRSSVLFENYPSLQSSAAAKEIPFKGQADLTQAFRQGDRIVLNVTAFSTLLESPLKAFLINNAKIRKTDYLFPEMDTSVQGTVVHAALQYFDLHPDWIQAYRTGGGLRKNQVLEEAFASLNALFLQEVRRRCGEEIALLPRIQTERWNLRLRKTAEKLLEGSCQVLAREWKLCGSEGFCWEDSVYIKGTIDRIEYDPVLQELHLIDFKTSNKADPEKAHVSGKHFTNLQLPLYKMLLRKDPLFRERFPDLDLDHIPIKCGYFSISNVITDIGYHFWNNMDQYDEKAVSCVQYVIDCVKRMLQGVLPENWKSLSKDDPFRKFFPYGYKATFSDLLRQEVPAEKINIKAEKETKSSGKKSSGTRKGA